MGAPDASYWPGWRAGPPVVVVEPVWSRRCFNHVDEVLFGPFVSRGPGQRRSLALTFDDGPSPGTSHIAEYLAKFGVTATFFLCGENVLRHPQIARELAAAGHELGNHTFSHPRLCPRLGWKPNLRSAADNRREFEAAQTVIRETTGVEPRLLRPPYGMRWWGVRQAMLQLSLRGVLWTSIGHDWEWTSGSVAVHVLHSAAPGGIICLHDGRETRTDPDVSITLEALHRIVPSLLGKGYRFETVSKLLRTDAEAAQTAEQGSTLGIMRPA